MFSLSKSLLAILVPALLGGISTVCSAQTVLKLFAGGGSSQQFALLRSVLDEYERAHPGVKVEFETGAATSELQRKYLSTLLNARDDTFDAFIIDIVAPAQFAAAGWLEPLDSYLGADIETVTSEFLPVYRTINRRAGQWVALPFATDALFLYYRKDLLEKYGLPVPETWNELAASARTVLDRENTPVLHGLSIQGAPIEGTVCTFLIPYYSHGREFTDAEGRLALDRPAALASFRLWLGLIADGVVPKNAAETKTADTVNEFTAGQAVFALSWGFSWNVFQYSPGSRVKDRVGVARPPRVEGGENVTTLGGWQWAVSAFSRHKPESAALIRYLTSAKVSRRFTLERLNLPSREATFADPTVLERLPWLTFARPVILAGKSRPVTPRYSEVSETLRSTTSAVLGGSLTPGEGVDEIQRRLRRVLR